MSSIFRKDDNYVDKPKRNTFDLSFQNNLTLKFGELSPVLCQEVLPGDSFKINPTFGLRFMPQVFPVQTRQRASIKFYYVRNRNLWKDWMDFIGKTKDNLTLPYLQFNRNSYYHFRPSGLMDYFGVPVKVDVPYGSRRLYKLAAPWNAGNDLVYVPNSNTILTNNIDEPEAITTAKNIDVVLYLPTREIGTNSVNFRLSDLYGGTSISSLEPSTLEKLGIDVLSKYSPSIYPNPYFALMRKFFPVQAPMKVTCTSVGSEFVYVIFRTENNEDVIVPMSKNGDNYSLQLNNDIIGYNVLGQNGNFSVSPSRWIGIVGFMSDKPITFNEYAVNTILDSQSDAYWCDLDISEWPWCTDVNPNGVRLSALPFRAYQAIYNALIRNAENNPFMINGVPEYNKYIESDEGGAVIDLNTVLREWKSNWSDDRFTTALPSPQQGNAPLVGLTGVNGATVNLSNDDGSNSTVHLQVDSDTGNVVMVDDFSDDVAESSLDSILNAVDYGITISDFRNVNSYQRWLENNIRRGYKYKDQLMSHYGVNARYDVLDMPEFIGGVSRDVNVSQVTATATTDDAKLGEYAGQSYIMGEGNSIEHYCDEHGWIIGIIDVKPMPLYQDYLPKHFVKNEPLDFYFPEFGKIGMQPITNKELSLSQAFAAGDLDGTFGYQRAWYDYLENLDSVHGLFRTDLRNFLIARDFNVMPTLSKSFLTMSSDDVNNTFYVDDDKDKIIGQIYFDIKAKRPIPLVGIPALE